MNHFIAITPNGGYIGRLWWSNSNSPVQLQSRQPGVFGFWNLPDWPGSFGIFRYLTR